MEHTEGSRFARMAVPCSIDRCAVGAPRAKDAQVIADIIGGTVRPDRQPVEGSGFLTSGAELMARVGGLPGAASGVAQRHVVGVPKPLIRPGPTRLGPPDALQRRGADPEPPRAWCLLPRPGPTRLPRPRPQRDPGRQVLRVARLSPACAHLGCGDRRRPPRWPEP